MHKLVAASLLVVAGCAGGLSMAGGVSVPVPAPPPPPAVRAEVSVGVAFFGVPLDGADQVVFVLDRSGSMSGVAAGLAVQGGSGTKLLAGLGGSIANDLAGRPLPSKLEAAKDELLRTLAAMPDGTRFNVVFFDHKIAALSPRMMVLHPGTRQMTYDFIRGIRPGGSTAAVPAMRLAYQVGAARVILLSDGLANTAGSGNDLMNEARGEMRRGLRIDTIGIGLDQDAALLRDLAAESGGVAVMR